MTAREARRLFAYSEWANARLAAAVSALSEEAFARPVVSSFGSVRDTFAHILAGEWIWLRRFKGESPGAIPDWVRQSDRGELLTRLSQIEAERREFLATLTDAELQAPVVYRLLSGQEHRDSLGELVQHVVNHSTYHRGQAVTQLRQLGSQAPATDLVAFLWETA
jgi:uncharacterized damage-inducible protein DinB